MAQRPHGIARVGIVGAGMAGLTCGTELCRQGLAVTIVDKGRGPGGRMSTRRMDTPLGVASFDFGATGFAARDPGFVQRVHQWARQGWVAPWSEGGPDVWVGLPAMNAPLKAMAADLDVRFGALVMGLARDRGQWWMMTDQGRDGPFDAVVVALPAEQAAAILSLHDFGMARAALSATSQPCWTAMFAFPQALPVTASCLPGSSIIERAVRDSAKPGRQGPESWVVQAGADWSAARLEEEKGLIAGALLAALSDMAGCVLPPPITETVHLWRYATPGHTAALTLWNDDVLLGACGDWLTGSSVEAAWRSGFAAARSVMSARDGMD